MRHWIHFIRRWWREFWGSEDQYVKGVRLGTRAALGFTNNEIFNSLFASENLFERDDFDRGWQDACIAELKKRGVTDDQVSEVMGW